MRTASYRNIALSIFLLAGTISIGWFTQYLREHLQFAEVVWEAPYEFVFLPERGVMPKLTVDNNEVDVSWAITLPKNGDTGRKPSLTATAWLPTGEHTVRFEGKIVSSYLNLSTLRRGNPMPLEFVPHEGARLKIEPARPRHIWASLK